MADDKTDHGAANPSRGAGEEPYEIEHFARKHGVTIAQAQELIATIGHGRPKLDVASQQMKAQTRE